MSYRIGETVIVTREGTNQVGVILDKFIVNKGIMYDILLENRSAFTMINTAKSKQIYINKDLTTKLCDTKAVVPTIDYADLVLNDQLPIVRA